MKQEISDWMEVLEQCRKAKLVDLDTYRKLNKEIRKMCKQAKEEWLNTKCDEIELNPCNIHQKIKDYCIQYEVVTGTLHKSKEWKCLDWPVGWTTLSENPSPK